MSLFNWFSPKSNQARAEVEDSASSLRDSRGRGHSQPRLAHDPVNRGEERKAKRHARREQLYQAVRESMTLSGVLSASYKFKVLSLDQVGKQFLVMMDVERAFASQVDKLADIETRIVQTASTRFEIQVTAVYWRIAALSGTRNASASPDLTAAMFAGQHVQPPAPKKPASRYDPIQADEVAAFKQALAVASATGAAAAVSTDSSGKIHSGPRSYTLLTGFEDTEMAESGAAPVLSATQYGDLI
ncbi:MAG: hypothetical protein ABIP46_06215 [Polaromonas sp.]